MLPLTFANPADYDKISGDDRVSIVGLKDIAPGKPLTMKVNGKNGKFDVQLKHTMNGDQIQWFKKGSALNLMREQLAGKL